MDRVYPHAWVSPYTLHRVEVVQQENQRRNDYRNMKFQPITPEKDPQKQPPDKERVQSLVPQTLGGGVSNGLERKPSLATNQDGKGEEKKRIKCINNRRDN